MCRDRDPARQRISCGGCGDARGSTRAVALCADDEAHGADDEAHVATWLTVERTRGTRAVMTVRFALVGTQFFINCQSSKAAKRQKDAGPPLFVVGLPPLILPHGAKFGLWLLRFYD